MRQFRGDLEVRIPPLEFLGKLQSLWLSDCRSRLRKELPLSVVRILRQITIYSTTSPGLDLCLRVNNIASRLDFAIDIFLMGALP